MKILKIKNLMNSKMKICQEFKYSTPMNKFLSIRDIKNNHTKIMLVLCKPKDLKHLGIRTNNKFIQILCMRIRQIKVQHQVTMKKKIILIEMQIQLQVTNSNKKMKRLLHQPQLQVICNSSIIIKTM